MPRLLAVLLLAVPAFAQSLEWRAVDVEAHLQRDGSLRVRERQQLVFDGEWNGGERDFNTRPHQWLELHGITRVENGREIALQQGSLDAVDRYDFVKRSLVRWRSRLPSDPPFAQRELTYVLDSTLHNVLEPVGTDGKRFRLDHDFGLPVRTGSIGRYTLRLDFDPVWNMPPIAETRTEVEPGGEMPIERVLYYSGESWPADVERPVPWWLGLAGLLLYGIGATILIRRFIRDERATGRFAPLPARFEPELTRWKPEIAGAIWDVGVGAPEVAATLARMAQEKKITTRAEGQVVLDMHLEVPRESLESYERLLADKLFFDGDDTSTERVKVHYKSTGFNPAAVIRPRIEWELSQIPGWGTKVRRTNPVAHALLLPACALGLLVAGLAGHSDDFGVAMSAGFVGVIFGGLASIVAWRNARAIADLRPAFVTPGLLVFIPLLTYAMGAMQAHTARIGAPILFTIPIWYLAILHLVLEMLKIREPRELIDFRRRIAGAREFFMQELQKQRPDLRDEWFPYVLAFGLGAHVDQWFRAFGGTMSGAGGFTSSSSFSSSSSSSSSSSGWTGGGGAFGGAGATGSWAMAATAMAAGVAAPSARSGGGGGGGGGGSSSGGGGGGGW